MSSRAKFWVAVVTVAAFAQSACYNRYFITKGELEKLESGVEIKQVVAVKGDCPDGQTAAASGMDRGPELAQSDRAGQGSSSEGSGGEGTASDASPPSSEAESEGEAKSSDGEIEKTETADGCTRVPVSTSNAINVVLDNGEQRRVTPFNFMMSEQQLVSPEYDLLLSLDRVKGAKVRDFSTWKTVGMIAGVTAITVGTFVGVSLTSEDPEF